MFFIANSHKYIAPYQDETGLVIRAKNQDYFDMLKRPDHNHCDAMLFNSETEAEEFIEAKGLDDSFGIYSL